PEGTAVSVAVRPEKIDVHEQRPDADNVAVGNVRDIAYLGDVSIYHVQTETGATLRVQETHVERSSEPHYDWGDTLWLSWPATGAVGLASCALSAPTRPGTSGPTWSATCSASSAWCATSSAPVAGGCWSSSSRCCGWACSSPCRS